MVKGLQSFVSWFAGMETSYVIIGGTACDIWCSDRGITARATKDIDMVLVVETIDPAFAARFLEYVREKGYSHIVKGTDKSEFYRFDHPADPEAPGMIELFSRRPDLIRLPADMRIAPVQTDAGLLSLSAILMDDAYYSFVRGNALSISDVPCVSIPALAVLKMKAWLDLSARKQNGEQVDDRDVKKHKNDVFRLSLIAQDSDRITLPAALRSDVADFFSNVENDQPDMRSLAKNANVDFVTYEDALERLRAVLGVEER